MTSKHRPAAPRPLKPPCSSGVGPWLRLIPSPLRCCSQEASKRHLLRCSVRTTIPRIFRSFLKFLRDFLALSSTLILAVCMDENRAFVVEVRESAVDFYVGASVLVLPHLSLKLQLRAVWGFLAVSCSWCLSCGRRSSHCEFSVSSAGWMLEMLLVWEVDCSFRFSPVLTLVMKWGWVLVEWSSNALCMAGESRESRV